MLSSKTAGLLVFGAVGLTALVASTARKHVWSLSHGKTGYQVELSKVPTWALLAEDTLDSFPCIHPKDELMWHIGFGRDPEGGKKWTLGWLLSRLCEARHNIVSTAERRYGSIPIDRDLAQRLEPEWVAECDAIFADDD